MNDTRNESPISTTLRKAIREAGRSLASIERDTGVKRQSIMRFVRGDSSLRLDIADRLASYLGVTCSTTSSSVRHPSWWVFYIDGHEWLDEESHHESDEWWACHQECKAGDYALIYAKRPVSGLVGVLRVEKAPKKAVHDYSSHPWACAYNWRGTFDSVLRLKEMRVDEELSENWELVRRDFRSDFGKPPRVPDVVLGLLRKRIANFSDLTSEHGQKVS